MKSFALIRTNPALTTNIKVVVDSQYGLSLESFDSVSDLSSQKFKKVSFNKDNPYDELLPFFFKDVSPDVAYSVKYDNDNDKMADDFDNQFDDIYYMGSDNIGNTDYREEFEYFAPLHINPNQMPKYFVLLRADGPGIIDANSDNFREEILENFKIIKTFDLTRRTPLGEWLETNYTKNVDFPDNPFDIDIRDSEPSIWSGIDYTSGGFVNKSFYVDEQIEKENTFFEFDKFITDGYKNNKIVYPNILNLKFLFDDNPATATSLRKWSINRYYGFYLNDVELVKTVSPYSPPKVKTNVKISANNILEEATFTNTWKGFVGPLTRDWDEKRTYYIEIGGNFYKLVREFRSSDGPFEEILVSNGKPLYDYQIISDIDLSGREAEINKEIITFSERGSKNKNAIDYNNNFNTGAFTVDDFDSADFWVIEIDGLWHTLKYDSDESEYYVQTDWTFKIFNNKLRYWVNSGKFSKTSDALIPQTQINFKEQITDSTSPMTFKIYKVQFTDIRDFDTDIVDTEFSKFEYEESEDITFTDEIKMYVDNVDSLGEPKPLDEFEYKDEIILVPAASEYTSTREIFEVEVNNDLTSLWRKNALSPKWGYMNSISHNDYPYRYNNNLKADIFNKTTNTLVKKPARVDRNLDYFYTINPDNNNYINHSLHITDVIDAVAGSYSLNTDFEFEVDKYFDTDSNYFNYFFGKKEYLADGDLIRCSNKSSIFNQGDSAIPNSTLFRGMKFSIQKVNNAQLHSNGDIKSFSLESSNEWLDWKFSIFLGSFDKDIDNEFVDVTTDLNWQIIESWRKDEVYLGPTFSENKRYIPSSIGATGLSDIVNYHGILYEANQKAISELPTENPSNSGEWDQYTIDTIFWNPTIESGVGYNIDDLVYNSGNYYKYTGAASGLQNPGCFWEPERDYDTGDTVIFQNSIYTSLIDNNVGIIPPKGGGKNTSNVSNSGWTLDSIGVPVGTPGYALNWDPVPVFEANKPGGYESVANPEILVFGNDAVYKSLKPNNTANITDSLSWSFVYSIEPDTDRIYGDTKSKNNIISLNGTWYKQNDTDHSSTLDNGINIYINKKWKNVLMNIYINDNTVPNIKNSNRDVMYKQLNEKLSGRNFMDAINDLSKTYGFTNPVNYYIIETDGSFVKYDKSNYASLPIILTVEEPDRFSLDFRALNRTIKTPNKNLINPLKQLKGSEINNIDEIDYYNGSSLGVTFTDNKAIVTRVDSQHGLQNIESELMFRFSGPLMPIFKSLNLFKCPEIDDENESNINYLFDTEFTNFGEIEEVVSKVSKSGNILLFRDNEEERSIYPMIDEFGYTVKRHFIFKSTWDLKYFIEAKKNI